MQHTCSQCLGTNVLLCSKLGSGSLRYRRIRSNSCVLAQIFVYAVLVAIRVDSGGPNAMEVRS